MDSLHSGVNKSSLVKPSNPELIANSPPVFPDEPLIDWVELEAVHTTEWNFTSIETFEGSSDDQNWAKHISMVTPGKTANRLLY